MSVAKSQVIREILSDGYAVLDFRTPEKPAVILVDGYYPLSSVGGGAAAGADFGGYIEEHKRVLFLNAREEKEMMEIIEILNTSGVLQ